jgi:quercetin 2,3-dioxygenase
LLLEMIQHVPYSSLGQANHGWLQARYHFSFADYHDPARESFGNLRVINDDTVAPDSGFGTHPHRNMEIITVVRQGAVAHRDSLGNHGVTRAGEVQVMSAGSGIAHSEHNDSTEPLRLYQIWIFPHTQNVTPRWETRSFRSDKATEGLTLLVSGQSEDVAKGALFIHQNARLYGGQLPAKQQLLHPLGGERAYVLASRGRFTVNDVPMQEGDGAAITGEDVLTLETQENSEIILVQGV